MKQMPGLDRILKTKHPFAALLIAGIAVRLALAPFLSFNIDLYYWMKTFNLIDAGQNLYGIGGYYYTPVWGYVIGFVDLVAHTIGVTDLGSFVPEMYPFTGKDYSIAPIVTSVSFNALIKLPLILTDAAIAWLIYGFVRRVADGKKALFACALWLFCPLTVIESSVHGMFDNISALFLLMAFIACYDRKYVMAGATYSLAVMTKFFPVFFIFLFVAMVLKNEGISMEGLKKTAVATVSAIVAMLIVEFPAIINGQFWDSLDFLLVRLGLSADLMDSVMGPFAWLVFGTVVFGILGIMHYFCRFRPDIIKKYVLEASDGSREKFVKKLIIGSVALVTVFVVLYSVFTTMASGNFDVVSLFNTLGKRAVMLLSLYTLIIEGYVAYKYLFVGDGSLDRTLFAFLISAVLIFLWPPAPQYVIVIVPALVVYAAVCDRKFTVPVLLMCSAMALYDIVLAGPSPLFSLAVYTDLISVSSLVPMVDFVSSYMFGGIPTIGAFMAVFGGLAYVSLLYILYICYKNRRELIP